MSDNLRFFLMRNFVGSQCSNYAIFKTDCGSWHNQDNWSLAKPGIAMRAETRTMLQEQAQELRSHHESLDQIRPIHR
jgi:hypothetical protein